SFALGWCAAHVVLDSFPTRRSSDLGGGGFSFMPLLVGYMMGSMLSRGGGVFSQPMVRTPTGYSTPSGNQSFASNSGAGRVPATRSEEHTSELQSRENLVCRLLLEKK